MLLSPALTATANAVAACDQTPAAATHDAAIMMPLSPRLLRRLILVGIAASLAIAIGLGVFHRDIDAPTAAKIADRLLAQYRHGSGEPAQNFAAREDRIWADGWEFRWRYRPCSELASLRVWISRDGRRASYAELPDCQPQGGVAMSPLKV
jgi:hypothetical protein